MRIFLALFTSFLFLLLAPVVNSRDKVQMEKDYGTDVFALARGDVPDTYIMDGNSPYNNNYKSQSQKVLFSISSDKAAVALQNGIYKEISFDSMNKLIRYSLIKHIIAYPKVYNPITFDSMNKLL